MKGAVFNKFVPKGWGYELHIVNGDLYCGKILHFVKGRSCSAHYHMKKTETFYVNFGTFRVLYMDDFAEAAKIFDNVGADAFYRECKEKILKKGDHFHIEPGMVHKMIALENSEIIEFSTTDYDDDSYRIIKGD